MLNFFRLKQSLDMYPRKKQCNECNGCNRTDFATIKNRVFIWLCSHLFVSLHSYMRELG